MDTRVLPIFHIGPHAFYVDLFLSEFRQVDDPGNRISFDRLGYHKHGYTLLYDHQTRQAWVGSKNKIPATVKEIFIPFKSQLDPVGLARSQGFPDDFYMRSDQAMERKGGQDAEYISCKQGD